MNALPANFTFSETPSRCRINFLIQKQRISKFKCLTISLKLEVAAAAAAAAPAAAAVEISSPSVSVI